MIPAFVVVGNHSYIY